MYLLIAVQRRGRDFETLRNGTGMGPSRPLAGTGPPRHRPAGDRLPGHEGQGEGLSLADDREAGRRSRHPQS